MLKEDRRKFPIVSSIIIWNDENNFHYAYETKREREREIDLTLVEG